MELLSRFLIKMTPPSVPSFLLFFLSSLLSPTVSGFLPHFTSLLSRQGKRAKTKSSRDGRTGAPSPSTWRTSEPRAGAGDRSLGPSAPTSDREIYCRLRAQGQAPNCSHGGGHDGPHQSRWQPRGRSAVRTFDGPAAQKKRSRGGGREGCLSARRRDLGERSERV